MYEFSQMTLVKVLIKKKKAFVPTYFETQVSLIWALAFLHKD